MVGMIWWPSFASVPLAANGLLRPLCEECLAISAFLALLSSSRERGRERETEECRESHCIAVHHTAASARARAARVSLVPYFTFHFHSVHARELSRVMMTDESANSNIRYSVS